jgi:hypothetical protein
MDSLTLSVVHLYTLYRYQEGYNGTVCMVGVNIYPKENDLPLLFAPTNICPLGCLDGGVNVDVDERGVNEIKGAKHLPHHICPTCLAP